MAFIQKSKSSTDERTSTSTQAVEQQITQSGAGSPLSFTGTKGGKFAITIDRSGFDSSGVAAFATELNRAGQTFAESSLATQQQAAEALSNIAQFRTGAQTEGGRILERVAVPGTIGLLALAAVFIFRRRGGGK